MWSVNSLSPRSYFLEELFSIIGLKTCDKQIPGQYQFWHQSNLRLDPPLKCVALWRAFYGAFATERPLGPIREEKRISSLCCDPFLSQWDMTRYDLSCWNRRKKSFKRILAALAHTGQRTYCAIHQDLQLELAVWYVIYVTPGESWACHIYNSLSRMG